MSALQSKISFLKELDLSRNELQDSVVDLLSAGLKTGGCKLEILRLSGCMISEKGCSSLASALSSNPSHLKELDLTYNHPGESGVKLLSARLEDPHCSLSTLRLEHGGENRIKPGLKKCSLILKWYPGFFIQIPKGATPNNTVVGEGRINRPNTPERKSNIDCQKTVSFKQDQNIVELSRAVPRALRASSTARLEPPSLRTHGRQASRLFSVLAPRWWNELPLGVRTAESLAVFKRRLKTHLFVKHLSTSTGPLFGQCLSSW
ncbi:hypothetical protein NFI96_009708 [Prochilodus magdalenae]|nr:hypothetical protein NFI96_009708 [Prochilodus magdalenae]